MPRPDEPGAEPEPEPTLAPPAEPEPEPAATPPEDQPLGPNGLRALQDERDRRDAAERREREAQARLREYEEAQLTETERLQRAAQVGAEALATGVELAREARLLTALADRRIAGATAMAALRLLDGVEYDDTTHRPTNLDDALQRAQETYGEAPFRTEPTPEPPPTPRGADAGAGARPASPPILTADELEHAEKAGMTPERFAALREGASLQDWLKLRAAAQQ
jgi:hypothetical protein